MLAQRKMFFPEEQNQKTFFCCRRGFIKRHQHQNSQESFASFLQKRRPSTRARLRRGFVILILLTGVPATGSADNATYPRARLTITQPGNANHKQVVLISGPGAKPIVPLVTKLSSVGPAISPDGGRIAFDQLGPPATQAVTELTAPRLVVTDWSGRIMLNTARVLSKEGHVCGSFDRIAWIDDDRIGVQCEDGPLFSILGVVRLSTGISVASYIGLHYYWSPDKMHLAHVYPGRAPPPNDTSDDVMIDDTEVKLDNRPAIHRVGDVAWSPDSARIAFFDAISLFQRAGGGNGADGSTDPHAYLVVAAANAAPVAVAAEGCTDVTPAWLDNTHIRITCGSKQRTLATGGSIWAPFNAQ